MTTSGGIQDEQQRTVLLDRLYRRVSKLDNHSLMVLEQLLNDVTTGNSLNLAEPTPTSAPGDQVSRRYFLTTLLAGGVLVASAGGAGAVALNDERVRRWLGEQGWLPTGTPIPASVTPGPSPTPTLSAQAKAQLGTLNSQIVSLTAERDGLQQQLTLANGQLSQVQADHALAQGLLDLYRKLETVNLDQVVIDALGALGMPILAIETVRNALANGVVLSAKVLQAIEDQMPFIAAGLDWLEQQLGTLSSGLHAFKAALQVSGSTQTAKDVGDFVSKLLDALPFGMGQSVKDALQQMGNLIAYLPNLLDNASLRVLEPARQWIVSGKQGGLYAVLIQPLRDQLLAPAQQIVANAQNLNSVYNNQLAQPAQSALEQRAKIRAEITLKTGA